MRNRHKEDDRRDDVADRGPEPIVVELASAAQKNSRYRATLWTGNQMQATLMSIPVRGDVGLEAHPYTDQLLLVEAGYGLSEMGGERDRPSYRKNVRAGDAVFVPAGAWHNITNVGGRPLKLCSVYAPPQHPYGTVHETKEQAEEEERRYR